MKKLYFLFAIVFAAGIAMAQNTSVVEQVGSTNDAEVTQTGSTNNATSHQFGDSHVVGLIQNGTGNIGITDQINGNNNDATINQDGTSNQAYLTQGMTVGYLGAGYASSNVPASNNVGIITQIGTSNEIDFVQVGDDNVGSVTQDGNGNKGYAYQGWAYGFWGETAETSALSSYSSVASVQQTGETNFGAVWQYGGTAKAIITQNGDDNMAQISQGFIYDDANYDFTHPKYNTKDNLAWVAQDGKDNSVRLFQLGDNNTFMLEQKGDGNTVGGRGLAGLEAVRNGYFRQDGDGNFFNGVQSNGATLDDESFQDGESNGISLSQGDDDWAVIKQFGNGNIAILAQGGVGNEATILQSGANNAASVTQN